MKELKSIQVPKKYKVLLIGDSCIDEYQYGAVKRISPEAPVPIFNYIFSDEKPGMVLNVKSNLESHGIDVFLLSGSPSRKIRIVDIKTKHHLLRIDHDNSTSAPLQISNIENKQYDAIVVSDYDKGYVTLDLLKNLYKIFDGPIYVDTKKTDLGDLKGCIVKINEDEYRSCITHADNTIVTLGGGGARYKNVIYTTTPVEVSDVCGAGDTFLSSLVYWHLELGSLEKAIPLANRASAITVQHFGTYAPSIKEYYNEA